MFALREEISQLKSGYYMAQRDTREAKKQHDMLEKEVESERKELAALRELLFREENQQVEDKPDTSISFPYRTKRRIVVFGGHDSWTREIKPKLPDVRFVDREMLPNAEMIKRADAVWIQHNALAHKFYYRIMDIVRKNDIPVYYFSYASASKCAEQIVREDMGLQAEK